MLPHDDNKGQARLSVSFINAFKFFSFPVVLACFLFFVFVFNAASYFTSSQFFQLLPFGSTLQVIDCELQLTHLPFLLHTSGYLSRTSPKVDAEGMGACVCEPSVWEEEAEDNEFKAILGFRRSCWGKTF